LKGLYLITPDDDDTDRLLRRVRVVLPGAALLQYRNKPAAAALRREQAAALLGACRDAGVPLVVNDDVGLARDIGADGVHLGHGDGSAADAREKLGPGAIVGVSCYADAALARAAVAAGASQVAFGAFRPSPTKPHAPRASVSLLEATADLGVPRVAIGGITPHDAPALLAAGADLIAVISGVFDASDPAAAARAYRACFD
jgi:thiamine-phosphate pyrophosphorylase